VTAGPAKIKLNLLLETGQIHTLSQKPLDFSADFDTADPVTIRVTTQVAWEVHPDSLLAALDDSAKFTDSISRHIQSQLTYALGKRSLAEIRANLAPLLRDVARSVNWTEAAKNRFAVREMLVVQLRLPPELISAATQLLIAGLQTDINRARRSNRFSDRYAEARARAKELEVIDTTVRKVEDRTLAFIENAVLLDQLSRSKPS
jgi:regulator of protease activity HflC (stomatin/prohibitin superfamily)